MEDAPEQQSSPIEIVDYENARLEFAGPLATLWLDDPDRLNALSPQMMEALYSTLIEVSKPRRHIRCLMITGEGRGFCAGANLSAGAGGATPARKEPPVLHSVGSVFHPLVRRVRDLEIPLVAAVNGCCVGFGVAIALLADYVIASEEAFFLIPFASLASCTDSGLTWLLPRAIGLPRARQMIMRAERVSAQTALEWGLINEIAPNEEFRGQAQRAAREYADGPTVALGVMRQLFQRSLECTFDEQLEAELRGLKRTARTRDNAVAMRNFGKKQKPEFIGE